MAAPGECSICLDVRRNPAMTPCMHVFCRSCIGPWLDHHSACPICRHRITRGRRALTTVRDNATPRRASSAPPTPPIPAHASATPRAARRVPAGSQRSTARAPSGGASSRATSSTTASRTTRTAVAASTRNIPQHRRSDVRAKLCTNRCSRSQREAFRRSGG